MPRFARNDRKIEQRVPALDVVQRLQHRVGLELVAVRHAPLQFTNPDRHARQFGGVFVELNAQHVVRAGDQICLAVQAKHGGVKVAFVFDVLERLEAHEQKVATATRWVKQAVGLEVFEPQDKPGLAVVVVLVALLPAFAQARADVLRHPFPFLHQWSAEHGLDDAQNSGRVGVMRTKLAALGGVQATLKQGAENRHIDGRPVQRSGVAQFGHFHDAQSGDPDFLEQPTVEPGDVVVAVQATVAHGGKQVGQAPGQLVAGELLVIDQALEHAPGQQAHVFGKKAEQALCQEVGDFVGVVVTLAQTIGQRGKTFGGGLGDVATGFFGAKALGLKPQTAQQRLFFGLNQFAQQHRVDLGRVAVELGVDANGETVTHHQQRWVGERQAVGEQLLQGGVQVLAGRLVFPGEVVAHEDVGITPGLAQYQRVLLKNVVACAARRGHAQQLAQVHEVRLRALAFIELKRRATRAPLGDEILRGHHTAFIGYAIFPAATL